MSAANLESFLARLYTDELFRDAFLSNPDQATHARGLDASEIEALKNIDREGLRFAAHSYAHKRATHGNAGQRQSLLAKLFDRVRRMRE